MELQDLKAKRNLPSVLLPKAGLNLSCCWERLHLEHAVPSYPVSSTPQIGVCTKKYIHTFFTQFSSSFHVIYFPFGKSNNAVTDFPSRSPLPLAKSRRGVNEKVTIMWLRGGGRSRLARTQPTSLLFASHTSLHLSELQIFKAPPSLKGKPWSGAKATAFAFGLLAHTGEAPSQKLWGGARQNLKDNRVWNTFFEDALFSLASCERWMGLWPPESKHKRLLWIIVLSKNVWTVGDNRPWSWLYYRELGARGKSI